MSQPLSIQRLLFLFLVLVLKSHAKSVADGSFPLKTLTNSTVNYSGAPLTQRLSNDSTFVPQSQDEDPIKSSGTIVYNRFEKPSKNYNGDATSEEDPKGPPDHVIPYSEHEQPRDVPTKPKYRAPGDWARPPKDRDSSLEDVPRKLYAQVRKTHTVRRLPRKKAMENAESEEERENAARLREVVKNSKVNTVYTEEGYEDSAYDHAGHIRDADFHEGYARKLHEQMDVRKKSEDGQDNDKKESRPKRKKYQAVEPGEFKDYDEDYRDHYETTTDYKRLIDADFKNGGDNWESPKVVAESGIQKLQEDLDKENEEIEKAAEFSKMEKVIVTTDNEGLVETQTAESQDRVSNQMRKKSGKRKKPRFKEIQKFQANENLKELHSSESDDIYTDNYSTTPISIDEDRKSTHYGSYEETTSRQRLEKNSNNPSETYRYEVEGNAPTYTEAIDFQRVEDNPTTVSYGQIFWDYFKARQNQLAMTQSPIILESSTLNPYFLQASTLARNVNGDLAYSVYTGEGTTQFPIVESVVLDPEKLVVPQTFVNPEYSSTNEQKDQVKPLEITNLNGLWQSTNTNTEPTTQINQFSEILNDKVANNGQEISFLNSESTLDSEEQFGKSIGDSFFTPTLNSFTNRKPRYKITVRPKSKKPVESNEEASTHNSISNEPVNENTTPQNILLNENYMKVLTHLRNEDKTKNFYPNTLQENRFSLSNKNRAKYLIELRPPLPQKSNDVSYQNYLPQRPIDQPIKIDNLVYQTQKYAPLNPKQFLIHPDSLIALQQSSSRKRNSLPSINLLPPAPSSSNEYHRQKEMDYLTRAGNKSKQSRNVPRVFRQIGSEPIRRIRGKRRERRSLLREGNDDGTNGTVKGVRSQANNGTSNRGEIERAAKNPSIERNPRRKVTRGVEVGLVPDTSSAKQSIEKKSRSNASDRSEGSFSEGSVFVTERESSLAFEANGSEGRNENIPCNLKSLGCDGAKGKEENRRKLVQKGNTDGGDLTNSTEKVFEENRILFNRTKEENNMETKISSNVVLKINQNASNSPSALIKHSAMVELINKNSTKQKRDAQEKESETTTDSIQNQGSKNHEKLLEESPRVTNNVIEKEIEARFNNTKKDKANVEEEDGEKNVEVEVPELDYVEEIPEQNQADITTTEASVDLEKYPFYENERIPAPSALKYALDPERVPRKTYGGMEFYVSRDAYKQCDEVEPNLKVVPEEEEPVPDRGPNENLPRLRGLGDKLDCFKAKYFDDNPFDNPLFLEKEVEEPTPPTDFDTKKFASRIMMFPKEDDDYVVQKSSRRPESYQRSRTSSPFSVRNQKTSRVRYKSQPRVVRRKRPQIYRVKSSKIRYVNTRRPQKYKKRPLSSASEISSFYTPYENQVYEDVMGTIKNMANSYQVYEVTTLPSSEESTATDISNESISNKTNSSTNSTKSVKKKENDIALISIAEHPGKADTHIEGMTPPKYSNGHRTVYRRNRIPQKNRIRVQLGQKPLISRTSYHRKKIRIYKRSLRNDGNIEGFMESSEYSGELGSREERIDKTTDLSSENKNGGRQRNTEQSVNDSKLIKDDVSVPIEKNSPISRTNLKTGSAKEKSKNPKNVLSSALSNTDTDGNNEKPKKIVYTIRDRIRYSKPKGEARKIGKFVNETKVDVDHRRKEPRYNYIRRKKPQTSTTSTIETPSSDLKGKSNSVEQSIVINNSEIPKENRKIQNVVNNTEIDNLKSIEKHEDQSKQGTIELLDEQSVNKTGTSYAVHENVNESEVTATQAPPSTTPSAFSKLLSFLDSDSPGYTEPTSEEFKKSLFSHDNTTNFSATLDTTSSKEADEKGEKYNTSKNFEKPNFSNEESSEKAETSTKIQPSTESSEEVNVSSTESESVEDKTFFTYASRPSSPAENYEDEKYTDLGPRVNKPEFFHPPFSYSSDKKSQPSSSEENSKDSAESYEEEEDYVFPWYKYKNDRKGSRNRHNGKLIGEYEFPWERRERLALKERRNKEKRKRFSNNDEEADESFVTKRRRNIYPRERYRFWNRGNKDTLEESSPDNLESSSESRPIMKYSSRYKSGNVKVPSDLKAATVSSTKVEEISKSIDKVLNNDSEEKTVSKENDSSEQKKPVTSYKNRGISVGMIVPEDITLAPRRKTSRKGTLKNVTVDSLKGGKNERDSRESIRNSLDNSESQIIVFKTSPNAITNSSKQLSKRRRRPVKNIVSNVEASVKTVTEASRSRRRQKVSSTTSVTSTTPASTTSASRTVRRKNQKSSKDSKKNIAKIVSKSNNDEKSDSVTSKLKDKALKKQKVTEESDNSTRNIIDQQSSGKNLSSNVDLKKNQEKSRENESVEKKFTENDEVFNTDAKKIEEKANSKEEIPFLKESDDSFEFKKEGKGISSDFDKSDSDSNDEENYSEEFRSILKSGTVGLIPESGAVQLTEQGSREVVSTVSWKSENYNF